MGNSNGGGEAEGHSQANGGSIESDDGGFSAAIDGEVESTATAKRSEGEENDKGHKACLSR